MLAKVFIKIALKLRFVMKIIISNVSTPNEKSLPEKKEVIWKINPFFVSVGALKTQILFVKKANKTAKIHEITFVVSSLICKK